MITILVRMIRYTILHDFKKSDYRVTWELSHTTPILFVSSVLFYLFILLCLK